MSRHNPFICLSYQESRDTRLVFLSLDLLDISHTVWVRPTLSRRLKVGRGASYRNQKTRHAKGDSDENGSSARSVVVDSVTVGATRIRCDLHGNDRQHAVRLDLVRQSDQRKISMGSRGDTGRVHDLRDNRNVA